MTESNVHYMANPSDTSTQGLMMDLDNMQRLQEAARMMAAAKVTVPKHLAGSPGDCLAVIMQAMQWRMNPFAVAQKTHIVNGILGYEAQLVNAVVSSSSLLSSRINYEYEGNWKGVNGKTCKDDALAVIVSATLYGESEPRSLRVSMAHAGVRNSPLWEQDPRQQLSYLATKRWARLHAPDVLLGVYTPDEVEEMKARDMGDAEVVGRAKSLDDILSGKKAQAPQQEQQALAHYPADEFAKNLPKWTAAIEAGRLTADQVIEKAEASKGPLTDEQMQEIRQVAPAPKEREPGEDDDQGDAYNWDNDGAAGAFGDANGGSK